ncbi:MAG: tRNA G18 (ribose-2'-O)-methylase SpoU [Sphingobacteriales bacterium]|jgi:tRNA G18 (ribose-2'-O)-methylase SpoU
MPLQLSHSEVVNQKAIKEISIICDGITSPENMGLIIRLADAFDVKSIHFYGLESLPKKAEKVARSASRWINIIKMKSELQASDIASFPSKVIALELTKKSGSIKHFENPEQAIAIVIGNEKGGVSEACLEAIEHHVHIPMFGKNSSINVSTALAIALFQFQH